mgnify:CR=1 FL=1
MRTQKQDTCMSTYNCECPPRCRGMHIPFRTHGWTHSTHNVDGKHTRMCFHKCVYIHLTPTQGRRSVCPQSNIRERDKITQVQPYLHHTTTAKVHHRMHVQDTHTHTHTCTQPCPPCTYPQTGHPAPTRSPTPRNPPAPAWRSIRLCFPPLLLSFVRLHITTQ